MITKPHNDTTSQNYQVYQNMFDRHQQNSIFIPKAHSIGKTLALILLACSLVVISDLQIAVRGRLRVRVFRTEHAL